MNKSNGSYFTTTNLIGCGLALLTIEGALCYYYVNKVNRNLSDMEKLKNDERQGRILAQQKNRNKVAAEVVEKGHNLEPIGYLESPYLECFGTPRQPVLVPAAQGRIRFDKAKIQHEHFAELKEFSHLWVIFMFHENTNTDTTMNAKIRPPRLFGTKVGCLSTRAPHRPNAIGLSVCEIVSVDKDSIEICCIDMVNGTPILDSKFSVLM